MNLVILTGHIGKDPEVFTFDNGNKKTSFSLATTESYKDKDGEWQKVTDWHNIALYRETKLKKGDLVEVAGKIKTRKYEKDGQTRYLTEVIAQTATLLHRKEITAPTAASQQSEQLPDETSDDLPF